MGHRYMDNGDAFMRAAREAQLRAAQQQANNQYSGRSGGFSSIYGYARHDPPTAGEQFEPEDVTGLKMLDEFLAKRKRGE